MDDHSSRKLMLHHLGMDKVNFHFVALKVVVRTQKSLNSQNDVASGECSACKIACISYGGQYMASKELRAIFASPCNCLLLESTLEFISSAYNDEHMSHEFSFPL